MVLAARENSPWVLRALLPGEIPTPRRRRRASRGCAHPAIVRVVLKEGARVNTAGERGLTPLACAAASGSLESVTLLLEAGAAREPDRRTARPRSGARSKPATTKSRKRSRELSDSPQGLRRKRQALRDPPYITSSSEFLARPGGLLHGIDGEVGSVSELKARTSPACLRRIRPPAAR